MTKQQFLEALEKKLKALDISEIQDILTEYQVHIDIKVADGKSEQESVADFGDIDELCADIISAYKGDPNFKAKSFKNNIEYFLSKISNFFNLLISAIVKLDSRKILKIIFKFILLSIILLMLYIPINYFAHSLYPIFGFLPRILRTSLISIIYVIIDLVYFIIVLYVYYIFVRQNLNLDEVMQEKNNVQNPQNTNGYIMPYTITTHNAQATQKDKTINVFAGILLIISRIVIFFIAIPMFFTIAGGSVITAIVVIVALQGFPTWGIALVGIGCCICGYSMLGPALKFVVRGRISNEKVSD